MLARLSIRDIVLIDKLDLDFAKGLAVLTGETGAGKSILLDAFALALGARGDATLVRQGQAQGQVTAMFELPRRHPAWALLKENGIEAEDALILRRVQLADGKTRAFVNDQPVSVQTLKSLGTALVEIHGQHDDRALVDAATHRRLLDAYGGLDDAGRHGRALVGERRAAREAVETHRIEVERAQREADYLRHSVEELAKLAPEQGEETALADQRAGMMAGGEDRRRSARRARRGGRQCLAGAGFRRRDPAAGAPRRRRRRCLVEPAVKALDAALDCDRGGARASGSRACRRRITIRPSSSGSRSGCSRCARPAANTIRRSTASPRWRRNMPPISR